MNLCSIFVSMIIGFVILPKNMTVINVVPAGTDIKLFVISSARFTAPELRFHFLMIC